jgi:tetratricopeptide (TPR) repeat protein
MISWKTGLKGLAALGVALALVAAPAASARKDKEPEPAKEEAPKADYSKEFRKLAAPVQTAVNEKKWADVLAALPQLEAIPNATRDDRKAIATWKLQATQGVGDQDAFAAAIESFLAEGFADPENVGAMHRQLAAYYSSKKDNAKTLEHFQAFVDATPDVQTDELETLGRLHMQAGHYPEACATLGKAIDASTAKNEKPRRCGSSSGTAASSR